MKSYQTQEGGTLGCWIRRYFLVLLLICMATGYMGACGESGCMLCGGGGVKVQPGEQKTGQIRVILNNIPRPPAGQPTRYVSVSYEGSWKSGAGQSGRTSFTLSKTYEVSSSGVNPTPSHDRSDIRVGQWEVTARSDGWSSSRTQEVKKAETTTFTFTYGQQ